MGDAEPTKHPHTASSSQPPAHRQTSTSSVVTIGNFEIGKTIGMGTFGKVKLGIHKITHEKVAVKVMDKDKLVDAADKKRLQREISILRKIRHPNIIQLYEIIETPRQLFLFMEYAPNGELFDYIVKRTRLSEKQASKFLQQIISGVEYISKIGVVHRDLKPENLLLDHNFNIKIVDFGLSNTYKDKNEKLTTACGSPCYAAPEMVAGKPYNGLMTDIWSSGVILYAMLCGYLPFEDKSTSELYKKIMHSDPALPSFLQKASRSMIGGILAKDPTKRFNIQDIRFHPFCANREPVLEGIIVGQHDIPIDEMILKQLETYSINLTQAEEMIKKNKHNSVTSTYYLLLLKFIREGGQSKADLQLLRKARSDNLRVLQNGATSSSNPQQPSHSLPPPALTTATAIASVATSTTAATATTAQQSEDSSEPKNPRLHQFVGAAPQQTTTTTTNPNSQETQENTQNMTRRRARDSSPAPGAASTQKSHVVTVKSQSLQQQYQQQQQQQQQQQLESKQSQQQQQAQSNSQASVPLSEPMREKAVFKFKSFSPNRNPVGSSSSSNNNNNTSTAGTSAISAVAVPEEELNSSMTKRKQQSQHDVALLAPTQASTAAPATTTMTSKFEQFRIDHIQGGGIPANKRSIIGQQNSSSTNKPVVGENQFFIQTSYMKQQQQQNPYLPNQAYNNNRPNASEQQQQASTTSSQYVNQIGGNHQSQKKSSLGRIVCATEESIEYATLKNSIPVSIIPQKQQHSQMNQNSISIGNLSSEDQSGNPNVASQLNNLYATTQQNPNCHSVHSSSSQNTSKHHHRQISNSRTYFGMNSINYQNNQSLNSVTQNSKTVEFDEQLQSFQLHPQTLFVTTKNISKNQGNSAATTSITTAAPPLNSTAFINQSTDFTTGNSARVHSTSQNSVSRCRYLSVQRPSNKQQSPSPSIEADNRKFRVNSHSMHLRGQLPPNASSQNSNKHGFDQQMEVAPLTIHQVVPQAIAAAAAGISSTNTSTTAAGSTSTSGANSQQHNLLYTKRSSLHSINTTIPLSEKLGNLAAIVSGGAVSLSHQRLRKKMGVSMHEGAVSTSTSMIPPSSSTNFTIRMNKENVSGFKVGNNIQASQLESRTRMQTEHISAQYRSTSNSNTNNSNNNNNSSMKAGNLSLEISTTSAVTQSNHAMGTSTGFRLNGQQQQYQHQQQQQQQQQYVLSSQQQPKTYFNRTSVSLRPKKLQAGQNAKLQTEECEVTSTKFTDLSMKEYRLHDSRPPAGDVHSLPGQQQFVMKVLPFASAGGSLAQQQQLTQECQSNFNSGDNQNTLSQATAAGGNSGTTSTRSNTRLVGNKLRKFKTALFDKDISAFEETESIKVV